MNRVLAAVVWGVCIGALVTFVWPLIIGDEPTWWMVGFAYGWALTCGRLFEGPGSKRWGSDE